jgi:hypothetical protein
MNDDINYGKTFYEFEKEYFFELDRNKQILEIERMAESFL